MIACLVYETLQPVKTHNLILLRLGDSDFRRPEKGCQMSLTSQILQNHVM